MMKHAWMTAARLSAATLAAALVTGTAGAAETFPNRPMRIVTTDIGNNNDLLARLLAEALSRNVGQQVVVENRGGAGGGITIERLVASQPDGHTIMVHGTSVWLLPLLRPTPWDPFRDLAPISTISRNPAILLVPASLPPRTTKELIEYARARPGQLNYVSVDDGSPSHLAAELFISMAGLKIVRIAYKGGGAAFTGLMAGEGQMMVNAVAPAMPHIKAGRLRGLGLTSKSELFTDLPLVSATLPGFEWVTNQIVATHARTPAPLIKRLNEEVVKAINSADMKEKAHRQSAELRSSTPQEVTAMMKTQMSVMSKVLKSSGVGAQ
jgi:tripartite-type tricarboxylate transporter receptor subunit TctC